MTSGLQVIHSFIHSFNKFYRDFCHAPGILLRVGELNKKRHGTKDSYEVEILV